MEKIKNGGDYFCYYCKHCDVIKETCKIDDEELYNLDYNPEDSEYVCICYEELPII